ncbi:MAG: hypothetical protein Kow0047_31060 [Anaerolineae bacterium]
MRGAFPLALGILLGAATLVAANDGILAVDAPQAAALAATLAGGVSVLLASGPLLYRLFIGGLMAAVMIAGAAYMKLAGPEPASWERELLRLWGYGSPGGDRRVVLICGGILLWMLVYAAYLDLRGR